MKKYFLLITALVITSAVFAANSANHIVNVNIDTINEVEIIGGNITFTLTVSNPGADPDTSTDNTTCDLEWTTNLSNRKITVASNILVPVHTLKITATNISGGTAASQVTLSDNTAKDFITAISQTVGNCDLSYEAIALASEGDADDAHTITYSVVAGV